MKSKGVGALRKLRRLRIFRQASELIEAVARAHRQARQERSRRNGLTVLHATRSPALRQHPLAKYHCAFRRRSASSSSRPATSTARIGGTVRKRPVRGGNASRSHGRVGPPSLAVDENAGLVATHDVVAGLSRPAVQRGDDAHRNVLLLISTRRDEPESPVVELEPTLHVRPGLGRRHHEALGPIDREWQLQPRGPRHRNEVFVGFSAHDRHPTPGFARRSTGPRPSERGTESAAASPRQSSRR